MNTPNQKNTKESSMSKYEVGNLIKLNPGMYGSHKDRPNQDFILDESLIGVITKKVSCDLYEEIEVLVDGEVFCIPTSCDVNDKLEVLRS